MRLRHAISITLLLLISLPSFGQRFKPKQVVGKPYKNKAKAFSDYAIPLSGGKYLNISTFHYGSVGRTKKTRAYNRYSMLFFQYFNSDLTLTRQEPVILKLGDKVMNYDALVRMDKGYLLFMDYDNRKTGKRYLFACWYDPESRTYESDPIMIAEVREGDKRQKQESFSIRVGPEGKTFSVLATPPQNFQKRNLWSFKKSRNSKPASKFDFWVYDDSFKLINFRERYRFEVDGERDFRVRRMLHDVNGNVYVVGLVHYVEEKGRRKSLSLDNRNYNKSNAYETRFIIRQLRPDGEDRSYEPESSMTYINGGIAYNHKHKRIEFFGLEGEIIDSKPYLIQVHHEILGIEDFEVQKSSYLQFTEDMYTMKKDWIDGDTRQERKRARRIRRNKRRKREFDKLPDKFVPNVFRINEVHFAADGTPAFTMEKKHVVVISHTTTNSNGITTTTYTYYYHYMDAYVCVVKDDILESVKIEKDHYLVNYDIGYELRGTVQGNMLYLLADLNVYRLDLETMEFSNSRLHSQNRGKEHRSKRAEKRGKGKNNSVLMTIIDVNSPIPGRFVSREYKRRRSYFMSVSF